MQRFENPDLVILFLVLIPLIVLFFLFTKWKKTSISQNFNLLIFKNITEKGISNISFIKFSLLIFSLILLIFAMMNFQKGNSKETMKGKGIDIMILLDVSNSMLAQDIQPNRLERSKLFINKLLDQLGNNRIGLIIFAGEAYTQVPITIDHEAIKLSLPIIDPSFIPSQGTSIGDAVEIALNVLNLSKNNNKAMIILTDGEDNEGKAIDLINKAKKNGIKTISIGVGSEEGAKIPLGNGQFKTDENGNEVISKFNKKMLEELATIGNGAFYQFNSTSNITDDVAFFISKIEKNEYEEQVYTNFTSYFYYFLIVSLLSIFVYFILPYSKDFFSKKSLIIIFMFSSSLFCQNKEEADNFVRKANHLYNSKKFKDAEILYRKALSKDKKNFVASYNLANTLYYQNKYQESINYYKSILGSSNDKMTKARVNYNLGNAFFKDKNTQEAIKNYESSLCLNPDDLDCKINLAFAKKEQKSQNGGGKSNQKNKNSQNDKSQNGQKQENNGNSQDNNPSKTTPQNNSTDQRQSNLTKQQSEQLLEALKNNEQETKTKVEKSKNKPQNKKSNKDW